MSFFKDIAAKPWTDAQAELDNQYTGVTFDSPKTTIGFRVLLIVLSVFFLLLYIAYVGRVQFATWIALPNLSVLWLNTAVLMLCSLSFIGAQYAAASGDNRRFKTDLLLSGCLSFAFLAGQALVWNELVGQRYFASTNPINGFFYLFSGIHALHVIGGLVAWGRVSGRAFNGVPAADLMESIRRCAHYWHFLLAVWLVIFLSVPQYLTLFPDEGWQAWCNLF